MYYAMKKVAICFWIVAAILLIWSLRVIWREAPFQEPILIYILLAIPVLLGCMALTLTLVSKALLEQTISSMNMISKKQNKDK